MSAGNQVEAELKELVAKTLEEKGVLGKVKAQLRASVFLALQEQDTSTRFPLNNDKIRNFLASSEGKLVAGLVLEFLDFFELESSKAVFEVESSCGSLSKSRKLLLDELPAINEFDVSSGPLLSTVVKKLTSKMPNLPTQSLPEKYSKYITKSDEFHSKTEALSGAFSGDSVFVHGSTFGGLKEDLTKTEMAGNDSVRRSLDFGKAATSLPPVVTDINKRLATGTSDTSTAANVEGLKELPHTKASTSDELNKILDTGSFSRKEVVTDPKLLVTQPPNPIPNTLATQLLKDTNINDYDEDFYSEDEGSIHTSSVSSEHSDDAESQTLSTNKLETTDHTVNLSQGTEFDITETINT